MKRHAPATLRNREAILDVLGRELPISGLVLEIASGSGEHVVYFAQSLKALNWQPSDPDPDAIASINAYIGEANLPNVNLATSIDARAARWPVTKADAILCANMVHIAPQSATQGLFAGAAKVLPAGAPVILYGPYFEEGTEPAASNLEFDESLRERDPDWGIRQIEWVDAVAMRSGFARASRHEMPANNLAIVYRRI